METELDDVSVRLDGRASIEHQIDIHVLDLTETGEDILLFDVLHGLKYVMEYRIKGQRYVHLDAGIMKRLCDGLLIHTGEKEGSLLSQRPTVEADLAFSLFADFLEEVIEFRNAVGEVPVTDLAHSLKVHRRCQSSCTEEQKQAASKILHILTTKFSQFSDWKELVKSDEYDQVENVLKSFQLEHLQSPHPSQTVQPPFCMISHCDTTSYS